MLTRHSRLPSYTLSGTSVFSSALRPRRRKTWISQLVSTVLLVDLNLKLKWSKNNLLFYIISVQWNRGERLLPLLTLKKIKSKRPALNCFCFWIHLWKIDIYVYRRIMKLSALGRHSRDSVLLCLSDARKFVDFNEFCPTCPVYVRGVPVSDGQSVVGR